MKKSATSRAVRVLILPLAAAALIPVLLTELHFFSIHDLVGASISDTFFLEHGAQGLIQGHLPYGPHFPTAPYSRAIFVYPPLTLLLAVPPLLAGPYYSFGFAVEMVVLLAAGLWLVGSACRRAAISFPVVPTSALLLVAMGPVVVTRVDALQGLALAGAALALRSRRMALAVALVTLAALVKETVVVAALPVVLWALWPPEGEDWRKGLRKRASAVALGALPAALVLLTFEVWSQGNVLAAAAASIHRGVEVESVPATISYLMNPIFGLTSYIGKLASVQVSGPQVPWTAASVAVIGAVAIVWGAIHFARARRRPASAIAFAVAVALATTPVLSPQYLLALVPVLVLAAGTEVKQTRANLLLASCLGVALLTQVEFPYLFTSVALLHPVGTAIVAARNLLLIALAVNLARPAPGPADEPEGGTVRPLAHSRIA